MNGRCTIILVNWNGWQDTIECMESINRQDYPTIDIVVVDNNSSDDSVSMIRQWAKHQNENVKTKFPAIFSRATQNTPKRYVELEAKHIEEYAPIQLQTKPTIYLIKNHLNAGFSKANNLAISFSLNHLQTDYFFLLNNDTVIEHNTVSRLVSTLDQYPKYAVVQPAIFYYDYPERVWNAGGRILPWAQIKYYRTIKAQHVQSASFITGCALFCKSELFRSIDLLTERFFHGEEDFEFSLRLKKEKLKAGVVYNSTVYHKIGMSVSKKWINGDQRILNFALNRLINLRYYFSLPVWRFWRILTLGYFYYLMLTYYKLSPKYSAKLLWQIYVWSRRLTRVNKRVIKHILERING